MKTILLSIALAGFLGTLPFGVGATAPRFTVPEFQTKIADVNEDSIGKIVLDIADFGTKTAAVVAVVMILWAGLVRITAAGESSRVEESSEIMWGAIVGLVLALGAVFLLNAVNPDLTKVVAIKFPEVTQQQTKDVPKVGLTQAERGEVGQSGAYTRPAPGSVANSQPVRNMNGIRATHDNDRDGIPNGTIRRSDGQLVPIDPHLMATLNALQAAGIPVNITSLVGGHSQFVEGSNPPRQSRHWDAAAFDGADDKRVTGFVFEHRQELGVQQIISGRFPQYNIRDGVPFTYQEPTLEAHRDGHTHYGY